MNPPCEISFFSTSFPLKRRVGPIECLFIGGFFSYTPVESQLVSKNGLDRYLFFSCVSFPEPGPFPINSFAFFLPKPPSPLFFLSSLEGLVELSHRRFLLLVPSACISLSSAPYFFTDPPCHFSSIPPLVLFLAPVARPPLRLPFSGLGFEASYRFSSVAPWNCNFLA